MEIHPDFLNLLEEVSIAESLRKTGSYAPMAASLDAEGIVSGGLFTSPQPSEDSAVDDAIGALIAEARDGFQAGRFVAAIIIFHGYQDGDRVLHIAHRPEEATSFVAWLLHSNGETMQAIIPYGGEPVFSPLPTETPPPPQPEPEIVFVARTAPREGESTVLRIERASFDLLQARLALFRELDESHKTPIAGTIDRNGVVGGDELTIEGLKASRSIEAIVNHYSNGLRQEFDADLITAGVIIAYAVGGQAAMRLTFDASAATHTVAWLAHKSGQFVQMFIAREDGSTTGEYLPDLPLYSGQQASWPLRAPDADAADVRSCAFSIDGEGVTAAYATRHIVRWTREAPDRPDAFVSIYQEQTACAVSGDGLRCMVGSSEGKVTLWDLATRVELRRHNAAHEITACALDYHGRRALVSFSNGVLMFWDVEVGVRWSYPEHHGRSSGAHVCAIGSDGNRVLTAWPDGAAIVWDWGAEDEPIPLRTIPTGDARITGAAVTDVTAYGTTVLIARADGRCTVLTVAPEPRARQLEGRAPVYACALSGNGLFALTSHLGTTVLWDTSRGDALQRVATSGHHSALAFSFDGKSGLLGHTDGTVTVVRFFPA